MLEMINELTSKYQQYLVLVGFASGIVFVISLLLTPYLLGLIPEDYFIDPNRHKPKIKHPAHLILFIIRTAIGLVLFIAGLIMLVTPGQGIISILMGLFLMEFPGKQALELKIINHDPTFRALNWFRSKAGKVSLRR